MKKNIIKNLIATFITRILPMAAVIIVISAAISLASSDTLCEGLWKEFIENKTDEAMIVYKNVIEAAKGNDAGAKETAKKAAQRLEALTGKKNEGKKDDAAILAGPKFIASANLQYFLYSLTRNDEQLYKKTRESFIILFSDFVKEKLDKYKLPRITVINFSGELKPEDTDIIIDFDMDATFKKDDAAIARTMVGFNGFNLNWTSILFTRLKNEGEILERYKKAGLLNESVPNPLEHISNKIQHFLRNLGASDVLSIYSQNISEFISSNKLDAMSGAVPAGFKNALLSFDEKRMVLGISGDREKIDAFIGFLEKISGLKLLPVSPLKGEAGFDLKIKLADAENLYASAQKLAVIFNGNLDNASGTAKYKACIANLKCIAGAAEMYLMDNPKLTGDELKALPLEKFVSEKYLTSVPECPEGGKYNYAELKNNGKGEKNNGEYQCSLHGSPVKTIEFRVASVKNGEEKVVSQPRIRTLVYQDASMSMGTEGKDQKGAAKDANSANELKFLKIGVKLTKDAETAKSKFIIANMDISLTTRNGDAEKLSHFSLKIKAAEGSEEWTAVRPQQEIAGYKIYFKVK